MSWADRRAKLLGQAPGMTLDDVLAGIRALDAQMYVVADGLHATVSELGPELQAGVDAHRAVLTELFTYAPAGRCIFDGVHLLGPGDPIACTGHRARLDADTTGRQRTDPWGENDATEGSRRWT